MINKTADGPSGPGGKVNASYMMPQRGLQINPNDISFAKTMNVTAVLNPQNSTK